MEDIARNTENDKTKTDIYIYLINRVLGNPKAQSGAKEEQKAEQRAEEKKAIKEQLKLIKALQKAVLQIYSMTKSKDYDIAKRYIRGFRKLEYAIIVNVLAINGKVFNVESPQGVCLYLSKIFNCGWGASQFFSLNFLTQGYI